MSTPITEADASGNANDMIAPRELFTMLLAHQPLRRGDVVVVLCGEDVPARLAVAAGLMRSDGAPTLVLSGGRSEPPALLSAEDAFPLAMAEGIAFTHITMEQASTNTREQAEHVIALVQEQQWTRVLLVASAYHQPRAFLTFLKVLQERGLADTVRLISVAAGHTPWSAAPDGMADDAMRIVLLAREVANCADYQASGDVASYDDGCAYLLAWETRA